MFEQREIIFWHGLLSRHTMCSKVPNESSCSSERYDFQGRGSKSSTMHRTPTPSNNSRYYLHVLPIAYIDLRYPRSRDPGSTNTSGQTTCKRTITTCTVHPKSDDTCSFPRFEVPGWCKQTLKHTMDVPVIMVVCEWNTVSYCSFLSQNRRAFIPDYFSVFVILYLRGYSILSSRFKNSLQLRSIWSIFLLCKDTFSRLCRVWINQRSVLHHVGKQIFSCPIHIWNFAQPEYCFQMWWCLFLPFLRG
jgi:hypothetical protein